MKSRRATGRVPAVVLAAFGWLVPGGAYLLMRRYLQFAIFAILISATFAAGMALQGGNQWPQASELQGLDGFSALVANAGAFAKVLAGGPYVVAGFFDSSQSYLHGRLHEYGSMLLMMAGLFNLLALSNAFELRKAGLD